MDETEKLENTENQEMKPEYESHDPIRRNQALENASMVLGVFALFSAMIFYLSIPLASLAIITALLSRGNGKLKGRGFRSVLIGLAALGASTAIAGYAAALYLTNPEYRQFGKELMDLYMDRYGMETGQSTPSPVSGGVSLGDIWQQMSQKAKEVAGEAKDPGSTETEKQTAVPEKETNAAPAPLKEQDRKPSPDESPSKPAADSVEGGIFT